MRFLQCPVRRIDFPACRRLQLASAYLELPVNSTRSHHFRGLWPARQTRSMVQAGTAAYVDINVAASTAHMPVPAIAAVYPEQYDDLLQDKLQRLRGLFQDFKIPEVEIYRSRPSNFRLRTEFQIWHEEDDLYYIMYAKPAGADAVEQPAATAAAAADNSVQDADAAPISSNAAPAVAPTSSGASPQAGDADEAPEAEAEAAAATEVGTTGTDTGTAAGQQSPRAKKKHRKQKPPPKLRGSRVRVDTFPVGSELINTLMVELRQQLLASPILREKVFSATFHTTLSHEAMITLAYHKKLDDTWEEAARKLRQSLLKALGSSCRQLHLVGRSRKQKICLDADHVTEVLVVEGRQYQYMQVEGAFSQPNAGVAQHMLSWALRATRGIPGDLLELYCGNGNFTIPLAANFTRVVATEVSKSSVDAARHNIQVNNVDNIFLARMRSDEFTSTWKVKGTRERLKGLDWEQLQLETLLVDPPRSGLDAETVQLLRDFQHVVYISCNPETLAANLREVADTHEIVQMAAFDQFPYTHHLECGVLLRRKQG